MEGAEVELERLMKGGDAATPDAEPGLAALIAKDHADKLCKALCVHARAHRHLHSLASVLLAHTCTPVTLGKLLQKHLDHKLKLMCSRSSMIVHWRTPLL